MGRTCHNHKATLIKPDVDDSTCSSSTRDLYHLAPDGKKLKYFYEECDDDSSSSSSDCCHPRDSCFDSSSGCCDRKGKCKRNKKHKCGGCNNMTDDEGHCASCEQCTGSASCTCARGQTCANCNNRKLHFNGDPAPMDSCDVQIPGRHDGRRIKLYKIFFENLLQAQPTNNGMMFSRIIGFIDNNGVKKYAPTLKMRRGHTYRFQIAHNMGNPMNDGFFLSDGLNSMNKIHGSFDPLMAGSVDFTPGANTPHHFWYRSNKPGVKGGKIDIV